MFDCTKKLIANADGSVLKEEFDVAVLPEEEQSAKALFKDNPNVKFKKKKEIGTSYGDLDGR